MSGQDRDLVKHLDLAGDYIKLRLAGRPVPELAVVLGSGLGKLADQVVDPIVIPYDEVPYFPVSTVEGHAGRLVFGELPCGDASTAVVALQGRFHLYEGYDEHVLRYGSLNVY